MDLCVMPTPSMDGSCYIATFIDHFSRLAVVKTLKQKSDTPAAVKEVLELLENQSGMKVRAVRTDRGTEYLNETLSEYFKGKGIVCETTAPYTPEQNGIAERLNRTLLERTRAMLIDANLPANLWNEVVKTACYIRNRSPISAGACTPWELFFGLKPDVSHLRVFGCLAYAHKPKHMRNKLEDKAWIGTFVGYELGSKAYRIMLKHENKIIVSRDVVFNEAPPKERTIEPPTPVDNQGYDFLVPEHESEESETDDDNGNDDKVNNDKVNKINYYVKDFEFADSTTTGNTNAADTHDTATTQRPAPEPRPARKRQLPAALRENYALSATITEPTTIYEALSGDNAEDWQRAMDEEMQALLANGTWILTELPPNAKPVPVKWVYKVKRNADGSIERYKARLVAKGYAQVYGIDFNEVFAPVSKHTTLRAFLSTVTELNMELQQLDVKTAFLNGELEETIYMQQPPGYEQGGPNIVCLLKRALYGLRQAPRAWFNKLKTELEKMGFTASASDPSLYVCVNDNGVVLALVYVDDILLASKSRSAIDKVKAALMDTFDIHDLGDAKQFLGMEITRDRETGMLKLTQHRATVELLAKQGLTDCNPRSTPMDINLKISRATESDDLLDTATFGYRELVGSLLYLSVCTRPDIAYAVGALARHMANPTAEHWSTAKALIRYIAGTTTYGIKYVKTGINGSVSITAANITPLVGWCDADYAGDTDTRRSTTGYVFIMGNGAISWSSRLQPTVAVSTTEAEYMAAAHAVKEALWLRQLLKDLKIATGTIPIYCDSQGAIKLLKHPIASVRSKHIDVLHHFARERVSRKEVCFIYCNTEHMIADCLTKALPKGKHLYCCTRMGVHE